MVNKRSARQPEATSEHLVDQLSYVFGDRRSDSFGKHAHTREDGWVNDQTLLLPATQSQHHTYNSFVLVAVKQTRCVSIYRLNYSINVCVNSYFCDMSLVGSDVRTTSIKRGTCLLMSD